MKTFTRILLTALSVAVLAGCTSTATSLPPAQSNPYGPQPGDTNMMRGGIRVDAASIRLAESNPPQLFLDLAYFQPTPCYKLRVVTQPPDAQNRITLDAYAVAEKDKPCALMALSTPLHANLDLGSFPKGHYSVWLNGSKVGEFDS